ncbi:MAG: hypothetical protein K2W88_07605, partial [Pararheinheimera sp.]|nr:hypothetical protein [Rheinheimera sp.]
ITVQNQLARLEDGRTLLADFDLRYFRYDLAKPGYDALQQLKAHYGETNPALALRIDALYRKDMHNETTEQNSKDQLQQLLVALKLPDDVILPPALKQALSEWQQAHDWQLSYISQYHLRPIDLNTDGVQDYVLLTYSHNSIEATLFSLVGKKWQRSALNQLFSDAKSAPQAEPQLETLELKAVAPQWPLLQIGGKKFQVQAAQN